MALQTFADIKGEALVRLSANTTMAFYTDAILNQDVEIAHKWATTYKLWPFMTRHDATLTWSSANETYSIPGDVVSRSIEFLQVGGKRHQKTQWEDYMIYREDFSTGQERIWSDFGGLLYVNPNTDASGTIEFWSHYVPVATTNGDAVNTVFENNGVSVGNEAMVNELMSYAMGREKKYDLVDHYHQKAIAILDNLFASLSLEEGQYLTKNHGMFKRFDVLKGALREDLIKRDQFY